MKYIDKVIKDIPKVGIETYENTMIKYNVDVRNVLKELKCFEVDIPAKYDDNVMGYVHTLIDIKNSEYNSGNTYNYNGNIVHNLNWECYHNEEKCYLVLSIHRGGDVRGNYTREILLKFDYYLEFFEEVETICKEQCYGVRKVNKIEYDYDISPFSEYLEVYCRDTQEQYTIYAYDDESFDKAIIEAEAK